MTLTQQIIERPIILYPWEVKAILDGRMSQLRRVVKPQPGDHPNDDGYMSSILDRCPFGEPGTVLWVRETWCHKVQNGKYAYKADRPTKPGFLQACYDDAVWRPSTHMPGEAARLFLTVKAVRVERLRSISDLDCWAEGLEDDNPDYCEAEHYHLGGVPIAEGSCERHAFACLWDSTNAKKGHPFESNPFVWVVTFERKAPA